jgi:membrane associated rhomboid family serine protease
VVPIRDNNPTRITPFVTYGLIVINVGVFIYQLTLTPQELKQFFMTWALVPLAFTESLTGQLTYQPTVAPWMTLFTSQFLHGGFLHIIGNMLFLSIFGNNIEDKLGHFRYLFFYLACGALAALTQWFFSAYSTIPSLGASGAIAGVMGAYILRFPGAKILTLLPLGFIIIPIHIPAFVFLGLWFVQQAFYGVASLDAQINMEEGGIAYWAHAGGFVFGAILGPMLGLFSSDRR